MPRLVAGAALLLVVAAAGVAAADPAPPGVVADDMHELPVALPLRGAAPIAGPVTIYLRRDGGTVTAGWDDSAHDVSSVAFNAGGDVKVPAWRGGDRRWTQVVACVQERFGAFDVDVVTERPASGDYVMVMVGGRPGLFGYPSSVAGVAPYTGEVVRGAIAFVFSDNLDSDVETTCVGAIHEAGHALGLDHSMVCEDPMSYLWGCGEKRFQDVDGACGENEARGCGDGGDTQNSWRRLAANVGLRDGGVVATPATDPEPPPTTVDPGDPDTWPADADAWPSDDHVDDARRAGRRGRHRRDAAQDRTAPSVAIDGGDATVAGDRWFEVVVRAADASGIADVQLAWASEDAQYLFGCGDVDPDLPVTCTRDGDTFRFTLLVGTGLRAMIAVAVDGAGNQAVTDPRVVLFEEP